MSEKTDYSVNGGNKGLFHKAYSQILGTKKKKIIAGIVALAIAAIVALVVIVPTAAVLASQGKGMMPESGNGTEPGSGNGNGTEPVFNGTEPVFNGTEPVFNGTEPATVPTEPPTVPTEPPTFGPLPEIPLQSFCGCHGNAELSFCMEHPLSLFQQPELMAMNNITLVQGARLCDEGYGISTCIEVNPEFLSEYCIPCTQYRIVDLDYKSIIDNCEHRVINDIVCNDVLNHFKNSDEVYEDGERYTDILPSITTVYNHTFFDLYKGHCYNNVGTEGVVAAPLCPIANLNSCSFCECGNNAVASSCTEYPLSYFQREMMEMNNVTVALGARLCDERWTATTCIEVNPDLLSEYCIPCTQTYKEGLRYDTQTQSCTDILYSSFTCNAVLSYFANHDEVYEDERMFTMDFTYFELYEECYGNFGNEGTVAVPAGLSCPIAASCPTSSPTPGVR